MSYYHFAIISLRSQSPSQFAQNERIQRVVARLKMQARPQRSLLTASKMARASKQLFFGGIGKVWHSFYTGSTPCENYRVSAFAIT